MMRGAWDKIAPQVSQVMLMMRGVLGITSPAVEPCDASDCPQLSHVMLICVACWRPDRPQLSQVMRMMRCVLGIRAPADEPGDADDACSRSPTQS